MLPGGDIRRRDGRMSVYRDAMSIEIRTIGQERAHDYIRAVNLGYHEPVVDEADLDRRTARWVPGRWWAALDDEAIVATLRSIPLTTTMPGGEPLTSCGLTMVATHPTHRRRGLMSQMMVAALSMAREKGEPLTTLIAAEWPIYGRFGFGPATEHASYTLAASARWRAEGAGTIEFVDAEALISEAPAIYERHQMANVSEIDREEWDWRSRLIGSVAKPVHEFRILCRNDQGLATGYACYTVDNKMDERQPASIVNVRELIATDPATEIKLWRYLCELDWVRTVNADDRSVVERLSWWLEDGRHARQTERADFVWARPVDVAACLAGRTYSAPADLVIEVVDPIGVSGGRLRLQTDGGPGTCAPTTSNSDLTMPISTLGSILLGGHGLQHLAAVGLVDEYRPGAIADADLAFRTDIAPWSATWF